MIWIRRLGGLTKSNQGLYADRTLDGITGLQGAIGKT